MYSILADKEIPDLKPEKKVPEDKKMQVVLRHYQRAKQKSGVLKNEKGSKNVIR